MKPRQESEKKAAHPSLFISSHTKLHFHKTIIDTGFGINTPICQVTKCYDSSTVLYRKVLTNVYLVKPLSKQNLYQCKSLSSNFFLSLLACNLIAYPNIQWWSNLDTHFFLASPPHTLTLIITAVQSSEITKVNKTFTFDRDLISKSLKIKSGREEIHSYAAILIKPVRNSSLKSNFLIMSLHIMNRGNCFVCADC